MKAYTVEVHGYPKEYAVLAENKEEARQKAKKMWHEDNGSSVYESVVIDESAEISE